MPHPPEPDVPAVVAAAAAPPSPTRRSGGDIEDNVKSDNVIDDADHRTSLSAPKLPDAAVQDEALRRDAFTEELNRDGSSLSASATTDRTRLTRLVSDQQHYLSHYPMPHSIREAPQPHLASRRAISDTTYDVSSSSHSVSAAKKPSSNSSNGSSHSITSKKKVLLESVARRVVLGKRGSNSKKKAVPVHQDGSSDPLLPPPPPGSPHNSDGSPKAGFIVPSHLCRAGGSNLDQEKLPRSSNNYGSVGSSSSWLPSLPKARGRQDIRSAAGVKEVEDEDGTMEDFDVPSVSHVYHRTDPPQDARLSRWQSYREEEEPALYVVRFMERHLRIVVGLLAAYLLGVRHGSSSSSSAATATAGSERDAPPGENEGEDEGAGGEPEVGALPGGRAADWAIAAAGSVFEYVAVAWGTCVLILVTTTIVYRRLNRRRRRRDAWHEAEARFHVNDDEANSAHKRPMIGRSRQWDEPARQLHAGADADEETAPLLPGAVNDVDKASYSEGKPVWPLKGPDRQLGATGPHPVPSEGDFNQLAAPFDVEELVSPPANAARMPHPALDVLYIMDAKTKSRVVPNDFANTYKISTDYFEGEMLALIRTPDVDDPASAATRELDDNNCAAREYLRDKQRRFEFQFQVRLKKVPTGRVYFGVQLNDPVKLGVIQRAFVSAAMAFVRTTNPSFHYSFGSSNSAGTASSHGNLVGLSGSDGESDAGDRNKPIMAFPVEEGMNRVVITPPGQIPPVLGGEIHEDPEAIKKRRKGFFEWNLHDTYTLACWSAYVDFLDWRCLNLPGIRPFQLDGVIGVQPMTVVLYEDALGGKMIRILGLELSNTYKSVIGPVAREWMSSHATSAKEIRSTVDASAVVHKDGVETLLEAEAAEDDEPVDVVEEAKLAALGEGIYVESGDKIVLRELLPQKGSGDDDAFDKSCFVTYSGGFCVLQEHSSATIVIEKVGRRRKGSVQSKLIKSGDAVMLRLITKKPDGSDESRYLSTHRGWWLKWVPHVPTKNGVFTIHTHEFECSDHDEDNLGSAAGPDETQQSYLAWGNSFYLRHKRWSKYEVGVAGSVSSTYGGRLLGLYSSKGNYDDDFGQLEEQEPQGDAGSSDPFLIERGKEKEWMKPLQLRAFETSAAAVSPSVTWGPSGDGLVEESSSTDKDLRFSGDSLRMDVPAWIEILNRKDRELQLTYAVRVSPQAWFSDCAQDREECNLEAFVRFRTGKQLSHLMRVGQQWRTSSSPRRSRPQVADSADLRTSSPKGATPPRKLTGAYEIGLVPSLSEEQDGLMDNESDSSSSVSGDWLLESGEDGDALRQDDNEVHFDANGDVSIQSKRKLRRRKIIGTIASKSKTVVRTGMKVSKDTGKSVVRSSVMVGKGTVNAGKAIIAPIAKQRPLNEPTPSKAPGLMNKKRKEKDFGAAITRSMKRFEKAASRHSGEVPQVIAGELSALEQSCRTVSSMLTRMSSLPPSDIVSDRFSTVLAQEISVQSDQDAWFLSGSAVQLGVALSPEKRQRLLHESVVARCLWESHWREEWCGVFETTVAFYRPLSNAPCMELFFDDIQSVREVHDSRFNPLPGFYLLAIETAWMCRYVAFSGKEKRKLFKSCMEGIIAQAEKNRTSSSVYERAALWEARLWQDFASSAKSSEGKWAKIVSGIHHKSRLVLNNRRMVFDFPDTSENPVEFVSDLLSTSLSFSKLAHLKEHPELLVAFLDATSQLRRLPLQDFDLSSAAAFCFFVNLYHCLFQHALLLAVNGPLSKRSFAHFMRTSCYELGGDVFSLAELHACVIRGNMSRPLTSKPPAVEVSKNSNSYRYYALGYTNPRVNFVLNTGDLSSPQEVVILSPDHFLSQLNDQSASFLRQNLSVDVAKRLVVLPKVCDVYRYDFSNDGATAGLACLRYCLSFLDPEKANAVRTLLQDETSIVIRYQPASDQYRTALRQKEHDT